jgi:hypothetical protein
MFLGHINEGLALMQQYAKSYEDRSRKVIFIKDSFIAGQGVHSISKQIHQRVINRLKMKNAEGFY